MYCLVRQGEKGTEEFGIRATGAFLKGLHKGIARPRRGRDREGGKKGYKG
jgi:hypothetical protein